MALYYLLKYSLNIGIDKLQVMGDSTMVINWLKGILQVKNNSPLPLAMQLKARSNEFTWIKYTRVYMEHNKSVDYCSKEGLQLLEIYGSLEEVKDGHVMVVHLCALNDL